MNIANEPHPVRGEAHRGPEGVSTSIGLGGARVFRIAEPPHKGGGDRVGGRDLKTEVVRIVSA